MTSLREFTAEDLLRTSLPNLDPLTENYDLGFYNQYLATWPELFTVAEDIDGDVIGYSRSHYSIPFQLCIIEVVYSGGLFKPVSSGLCALQECAVDVLFEFV